MEAQEIQGMLEQFEKRMMTEIRQEFANVRREMAIGFVDVRRDFRDEMATGFAEMRRENANEHEKTRRYAEALDSDTRRELHEFAESLRDDIRAVADGVLGNAERIDRVEAAMKIEFHDVRDLIEVSYNALEGRVRKLENG